MRVGLLSGLRVLEIGESVAVAFAGKILADLGADVVMVEPSGGSALRGLPPYYEGRPGPGRSILHNWLCANKRSIILDGEPEQSRALLQELVRRTDALVRLPAADLGLLDLHRLNPGLTVVNISPFGADGPYGMYRSTELTLFALSGFSFYLASPAENPPRFPPKENPGHQVGLVAGLSAALATLWGVAASQRRGRGLSVDVSEWEAVTHLLYEHTAQFSDGKLPADRRRREGAVITVVGGLILCLPCSDGWVLASPREDHQFKLWGELIEDPAWAARPEFADPVLRERHGWEIYERSAAWTQERKKAEVYLAAQGKKIPCFPVSQMRDLAELEQLKDRRFWTELDHPVIKGIQYPGLPARIEGVDVLPSRGAPSPGEHGLEVREELSRPPLIPGIARDLRSSSDPAGSYQAVLDGVRILDFSWVVAGPFCTKLLALMGGEVIKIESSRRAQYKDRGAWFSVLNNSKKSCTVNLATDQGKAIVKQLVRASDVLVENFSTGVMDRLGLGYEALRAIKPDLIYVSSSGVGRSGPGRNWLAYGSLLQGLSGWTSLFSKPNPWMEGMGIAPSWTDPLTSLWEALIIQAALLHRTRTGTGLYVDLSMLECTIPAMGDVFLRAAAGRGQAEGQPAESFALAAPQGIYPCRDADTWIALSVGSAGEWEGLCKTFENPPWSEEDAMRTPEGRRKHRERLDGLVAGETSRRAVQDLFVRLQEAGVPAGPCYNLRDLVEDPHMQSRALFQRVPLADGRVQLTTGLPWKEESEWKGKIEQAPALGEHNEYVFRGLLQLSEEEYERYRAEGVCE